MVCAILAWNTGIDTFGSTKFATGYLVGFQQRGITVVVADVVVCDALACACIEIEAVRFVVVERPVPHDELDRFGPDATVAGVMTTCALD